jgi:hypothetical protein
MLGGALLVGVFAAMPADRREDNRMSIAISGVAGPALVAAAYFLAAPRLTVAPEQLSPYLFAPYAVVAGLAGAALVGVLGPMRPRRPGGAAPPIPPVERNHTISPAGSRWVDRKPTPADDSDLPDWTRSLASDDDSDAKADETSLETAGEVNALDADDDTQPRAGERPADTYAYGSDDATATKTLSDPAAPTATGRAAVTQPLWPDRPKPRRRGSRSGGR